MLDGVKVLDFTSLLPGPFATKFLADWGAEVVRIESPHRTDLLKEVPPKVDGTSVFYQEMNRSKTLAYLDFTKESDLDVIKRWAADADVVIEQFRPGVMAKYGLDYESLKQINSAVIYCSLTGYGQTGPERDTAGHDINYIARSGLASYSGTKQSGPMLSGTPWADVAGGAHHSVMAILMALYQRTVSGEGDYLDISMTDAVFSMQPLANQRYLHEQTLPGYESEPLNGGSFYQFYETSDERYMAVGSLEGVFFKRLCETIGREDLLDTSTSTEAITEALTEVFQTKSLVAWKEIFAEVDACVEPVATLAEAHEDPLFQARGMFVEVTDPDSSHAQTQVANAVQSKHHEPVYRFIGGTQTIAQPESVQSPFQNNNNFESANKK
ncbi:crotonobetainyl-CoA:carnitine CoA-transferase CaiB-like acyl-CoA transferase [Salsuginibacillus halophilus]|uniref:Crotonobetainyl-CoA:carnitine CoA-transferase CaiB-like acyl-CoA transferase n=1 Tax=Salsuginibacillus halophilus TaxID=517424 RepID=A0A2P8HQE3_9BACI|nr:CaiB/BaiF CoA-transferase family protein [Salsuginibacillus halophilus]PSL48441.1 crotonobetainyl-CoA:carnitine CoA-transferase CaiB-like acyl-CoA transferase [Salsuginibacillus halophilus]